ncbi:MAG: glycoside hydrolase family 97 protein [Chloroflexota bacterium]|nr:glycoside hydrolase family 97 protein [Chloroflexota bacterium]
MKPIHICLTLTLLAIALTLTACGALRMPTRAVTSPDGRLELTFLLRDGAPYYRVHRDGAEIIKPSKLGFTFKEAAPLNQNFSIAYSQACSYDETWLQPWGEVREIRNHYHELQVNLVETGTPARQLTLRFRVYNDGLGFRYELPRQEHLAAFEIMDEETAFVLTGDHLAWWIPAYTPDRYETNYSTSPLSTFQTRSPRAAAHTPLTMQTAEGLYLSFHEAALTDYAAMTLQYTETNTLVADLVPWSDGVKVRGTTPFQTPWRTLQVAAEAGELLTSNLILNLNEPNLLADTSWIKPGKYTGIWWGMHIGEYSWAAGAEHGATTARAKRYINFAAQHVFDGVLVEGWNQGWEQGGYDFDFTTPYADFDIEEVSRYAAQQGIELIGHHETDGAVGNYIQQLGAAFDFYEDLDIHLLKTGYVAADRGIQRWDDAGNLLGVEAHHGQYMVRHYREIVKMAAEHQIMLNVHEPIKPTGIRRTYPNMMTREGARGQEFNAWCPGGNRVEHTVILPFTRLLGGPMDFTPGIFDLLLGGKDPHYRVNTTLTKQLALYVVLYSPWQMAADLPENYAGQPAFQFIVDVPVDWEETQVLHAAIGDYVTIVRQERDGEEWYLGSITDELSRTLQTPLTFLPPERQFVAEIYADAPGADWETNPLALEIREQLVDRETILQLTLAPGGGQAIRFRPATAEELKRGQPEN